MVYTLTFKVGDSQWKQFNWHYMNDVHAIAHAAVDMARMLKGAVSSMRITRPSITGKTFVVHDE